MHRGSPVRPMWLMAMGVMVVVCLMAVGVALVAAVVVGRVAVCPVLAWVVVVPRQPCQPPPWPPARCPNSDHLQ